jgi:hypothetical protein
MFYMLRPVTVTHCTCGSSSSSAAVVLQGVAAHAAQLACVPVLLLLLDVNLVCRVVAAWHVGYVRVSCRVNGVVAAASAGMWTCVWMSRASHKDPLCC